MATYFISDLHLQSATPELADALYALIQNTKDMDTLYILGDFFDAWIGDDEDAAFFKAIIAKLKGYTDAGLTIFFMHGNRDFLIGEQFENETGLHLLADPTVIDLYGKQVLLMHGDSLCTGDVEYMQFRTQVRSPAWQQQILSLPLQQRRTMAAQLRAQSKSMNSNKAEDIMDVSPETVAQAMKAHSVETLIHGHTHRPHHHQFTVDNKKAERIVLGDWGSKAWYIRADKSELTLNSFSIT